MSIWINIDNQQRTAPPDNYVATMSCHRQQATAQYQRYEYVRHIPPGPEPLRWLDQHAQAGWHRVAEMTEDGLSLRQQGITFDLAEDAVMFRLTWG